MIYIDNGRSYGSSYYIRVGYGSIDPKSDKALILTANFQYNDYFIAVRKPIGSASEMIGSIELGNSGYIDPIRLYASLKCFLDEMRKSNEYV